MFSKYRSKKAKLILMSKGIAMGTADIIPGVSGGTIALISGIYDHFIQALDSIHISHIKSGLTLLLFGWKKEKRNQALMDLGSIEWHFLLPLFTGIMIAMAVMVQVIPYMMEHYGFLAFSFFFGLIIFSITVPYKRMDHRWQEFLVLISFALFTFMIVSMSRVSDARIEFVPDVIQNMEAESETTGTLLLETNQKGQWELPLSVDTLLDAGDPRCLNFSCLNLDQNSIFKPVQADKNGYPGDRVRLLTASVIGSNGDGLGTFRLVVAIPDLSDKEYAETQTRQTQATSQNKIDSKEPQIRAIVLQDDLKNIKIQIKKIQRQGTSDSDQILIKGSIGNEGSHNLLLLFISGAFAICAMVLPGISGAYILVLMGQYQYITAEVRDLVVNLKLLLAGGGDAMLQEVILGQSLELLVFISGIVVGLFSFVRILKYLLSNYHSMTMAALTGLMIGSLRYIWPPNHFEGASMALQNWLMFIGISIVGALAVFLLEFTANRLHDPDAPDPDL